MKSTHHPQSNRNRNNKKMTSQLQVKKTHGLANMMQRSTLDESAVHFAKINEGNRIFTIAYRIYPNCLASNIEYGASVFRKQKPTEQFVWEAHSNTARGRLQVRPVFATFPFTAEILSNLADRPVPMDPKGPKSKLREERRQWAKTEKGQEWLRVRREFDSAIVRFLRRQVGDKGTRNEFRLSRSDIARGISQGTLHEIYNAAGKKNVEGNNDVYKSTAKKSECKKIVWNYLGTQSV